ncbi:MAG: TIGR04282 family arsenosugar biosynthesis glycosyltransferase [Verrucomicrobiota bacterium]|nr:TIGR04282 family arsenosugar biosynthesis glycosyltransferase [Verrucomicrobiota bacterium]
MKSVHRVLDPRAPTKIPQGLCALAVMTKAPRAGKVKTRLTPPLTPEEAAELNICFLRDTAAALSSTASAGLARGVGVYTPVGAEDAYEGILPEDFELVPQRGDAFGERLALAIEDLLVLGFASVCLIDSDSPTVPREAFAKAAKILSQPGDCVVLGPSDDGGYYLIGLKKLHCSLFENIAWSTERVLEQTIERARQIRLKVHLLPTCYDVDDRATLHRLCRELFDSKGSTGKRYPAPATRAYLDEILKREGRDRIWPNES